MDVPVSLIPDCFFTQGNWNWLFVATVPLFANQMRLNPLHASAYYSGVADHFMCLNRKIVKVHKKVNLLRYT